MPVDRSRLPTVGADPRFLFPAIAALIAGGHLPESFSVTGAARQELDEEAFRRSVGESLAEHGGHVPVAARQTRSETTMRAGPDWLARMWQQLPLSVTRQVGPHFRRYLIQ